MEISITEQHLAVLKFKCAQRNSEGPPGQTLSESEYAAVVLGEALSVYEAETFRSMIEAQVEKFRKLPSEQRAAVLELGAKAISDDL